PPLRLVDEPTTMRQRQLGRSAERRPLNDRHRSPNHRPIPGTLRRMQLIPTRPRRPITTLLEPSQPGRLRRLLDHRIQPGRAVDPTRLTGSRSQPAVRTGTLHVDTPSHVSRARHHALTPARPTRDVAPPERLLTRKQRVHRIGQRAALDPDPPLP